MGLPPLLHGNPRGLCLNHHLYFSHLTPRLSMASTQVNIWWKQKKRNESSQRSGSNDNSVKTSDIERLNEQQREVEGNLAQGHQPSACATLRLLTVGRVSLLHLLRCKGRLAGISAVQAGRHSGRTELAITVPRKAGISLSANVLLDEEESWWVYIVCLMCIRSCAGPLNIGHSNPMR